MWAAADLLDSPHLYHSALCGILRFLAFRIFHVLSLSFVELGCQLNMQWVTHMTHLQSCCCCPLSCVRLTLIWTAPTGSPRRDFRPTQVFRPCNPTTVWGCHIKPKASVVSRRHPLFDITLTVAHSGECLIACTPSVCMTVQYSAGKHFTAYPGHSMVESLSSWSCRQSHYLRLVQQGMQWCKSRPKEDIAVLEVPLGGAAPL